MGGLEATGAVDPATGGGKDAVDPIAATDAYLRESIDRLSLPANLHDAVLYSLLGPGKRLRPLLAWRSCQAAGGRGPEALPAAAAVELVHGFSLVHDDLPAMDDDDLRRGRPTLHRHTSEAMAILAGDGMLTFGFGVLCDRVNDPRLAARLCTELARGTMGMIVGQVYDTLGGGALDAPLPPADRLVRIHANKTGALIKASCRMGALCAQASDRTLELIERYADAVGLMFQIVDDILDVTQQPGHVGKRTGKDAGAGKMTYPGVLGLEASLDQVRRLEGVALEAAGALGDAGSPLAELARSMAVRTR
ncbi:MAG TPA: polyprenyl synthetase family protein [Phycisphaerales bacterium]|nr:polyprenyl synthetase family protein [Phycisphaerales bacterium]